MANHGCKFPIEIQPENHEQIVFAQKIANQIHPSIVIPSTQQLSTTALTLLVGFQGITLYSPYLKASIKVDFLNGIIGYRCRHSSNKELIARAVKLKNIKNPRVLDITAGLGKDGFILASLGYQVSMVEKSPIVHLLLEDGLTRANQIPELSEITCRIFNIYKDSIDYMHHMDKQDYPEIIYVDPMFPERSKSALVKKEMQLLQDLVGVDQNDPLLLEVALEYAQKRVVVKRPRLAPPIKGPSPGFTLQGKSIRFDIYLI
ncbi:class I SAM-dependent methyltransferase [Candidatus Nitrosacidococcus tergens]|uniref:Ribosomal RNA small subunit methyltransferase J n=1 Tax=Candidatus Nitrosacidococcus tergens TaxID=553981 RepID=A0A7G1QC66_9GAMM|nr:class I SAM-dependent methyltransferase [Candidatus Nitrosacidococcus tergens]CAB1277183.1 Ribosomal RNA small subunit methyltransferase J [Candidatus Nitrosacidococcus tergens]